MALEKRGLSQAEAARRCGISQQSINYIITNNLNSSKLAPQLAEALEINPDWLIYGQGRFEEAKIYALPIIHSAYMLKKYLHGELDENVPDYTVINRYLGDQAFAYLWEPNHLAICYGGDHSAESAQYLTLTNSQLVLTDKPQGQSFAVFEWRKRHEDF